MFGFQPLIFQKGVHPPLSGIFKWDTYFFWGGFRNLMQNNVQFLKWFAHHVARCLSAWFTKWVNIFLLELKSAVAVYFFLLECFFSFESCFCTDSTSGNHHDYIISITMYGQYIYVYSPNHLQHILSSFIQRNQLRLKPAYSWTMVGKTMLERPLNHHYMEDHPS